MIFPINQTAQTKYSIELETSGQFLHVPLPDFQTARVIARRINSIRTLEQKHPVLAWQVVANAIQIFLMEQIIKNFPNQNSENKIAAANALILSIQPEVLVEISSMVQKDRTLYGIHKNKGFLPTGESHIPLFDEIFLRNIALRNPANSDFDEFLTFFDMKESDEKKRVVRIIGNMIDNYQKLDNQASDLYALLIHPFETAENYMDQLDLIKEKWGPYLGHNNLKLMKATSFIREELSLHEKPLSRKGYLFNSAQIKRPYHEADWMRNVVLISKNTPVWLGQLSKKYHQPIERLDQIPDEEFLYLRSHGINALWLIGIWERSPASGKIKALYGNTQAIASAYSIYRYQVAKEFGGNEALELLINQAHSKGFYMGCDMVPNHTGIDSPWVIDHPEWFIYTDEKPKTDFSFNSPNLSPDEKAEIFLEEGYYSQSGAAEVFKYCKKADSRELYIYHGNDGTSMPWNDTAQLNYLNPEARSAVREIIRSVAAQFDIIRFDAAMTLTRLHFKRLWFPAKRNNDHIPTRDHARMSQDEFDSKMPEEFWLEVTGDLKKKHKDTLLVAEAFWLMENFFINQLGMHRVYNSAFMTLLRDEENSQFREYLKDILKTDPLVLERFVNYLTTPDEMTAADQFGTTEKYFGMFTFLAVMPGLPMIGHGQIEGFSERYGMDFISALLDEIPDEKLIEDHKKLISPLLCQRHRFSTANNFFLMDFEDENGMIIEDVIAFINKVENLHSMVLFNNSSETKKGFIRYSVDQFKAASGYPERRTIASCLASGINSIKELQFHEVRTKDIYQIDWETVMSHGISFVLKPYQSLVYDTKLIINKS